MICAQVKRQLAVYSAGVLSEQQQGEIEVHLAGCDSCRQQLAQYVTLDAAIVSDRRTPDVRRTSALLLQLEQERLWRRWSWRFLCQSLLHLAGFVLLIFVAGTLLHATAIFRVPALANSTHVAWLFNHPLINIIAYLCLLPLALGIVAVMNALLARAK